MGAFPPEKSGALDFCRYFTTRNIAGSPTSFSSAAGSICNDPHGGDVQVIFRLHEVLGEESQSQLAQRAGAHFATVHPASFTTRRGGWIWM